MKFKLLFTIVILTTILRSFSMAPDEQQKLNGELVEALLYGNNTVVDFLLQAGADINDKDDYGRDLLHLVAGDGDSALVGLLLAKGADIKATDRHGMTALHYAAMFGQTALVELLLSHGADINAPDYLGLTPLHSATIHGYTATVELLLSCGANIHAKAQWDKTPLHEAALKRRSAIVELLLSHGADSNATDIYGLTPLHDAETWRNLEDLKLLRAYPALLAQAKKPTKKLLETAIAEGYYGLVKLLFRRGLKPNVSDLQLAKNKWQTAPALHKQSYEAIGRLLIQKLSLLPNVKNVVDVPIGGRISKAGIVGLYGFPEEIAEEIAKHL